MGMGGNPHAHRTRKTYARDIRVRGDAFKAETYPRTLNMWARSDGFEHLIVGTHQKHGRTMGLGFRLGHLRIGDDDDQIIALGEPRGGPIDPDHARARGRLDGIGGEARARVDVQHIDLLIGQDARGGQEILVDGNRPLVIEIALRHHRAMDFRFHHGEVHRDGTPRQQGRLQAEGV